MLSQVTALTIALCSNIKWAIIGGILGAICAWWVAGGTMLAALLGIATCLFFLDWAAGFAVSKFIHKKGWNSKKIERVQLKAFVYMVGFILCVLIDKYVQATGIGALVNIPKDAPVYVGQFGWLSLIAHREAISVLESLKALEPKTGIKIPNWVENKINKWENYEEAISGKDKEEDLAEEEAKEEKPTA